MKNKRTCANGHIYFKSSDCPVCPVCEQERKTTEGFLAELSAPARRALENHGVQSLNQLAAFSEKEILTWHGLGPSSVPKLSKALQEAGLSFKK
jgi:hypothetical protein